MSFQDGSHEDIAASGSDASNLSRRLATLSDDAGKAFEDLWHAVYIERKASLWPRMQWNKLLYLFPSCGNDMLGIRDDLQELEEGEDPDDGSWNTPMAYYDRAYFRTVFKWEKYVQIWPVAIQKGELSLIGCQHKLGILEETLTAIKIKRERISNATLTCPSERTKKNCFITRPELPDVEDIVSRIDRPYLRLRKIEAALGNICWNASEASLRQSTVSGGIRRRRIETNAHINDGDERQGGTQSSEQEESNRAEAVGNAPDRSLDRSTSHLRTYVTNFANILNAVESRLTWMAISRHNIHRTLHWLSVSQPTLWTLAMATGVLSAMVVTVSAIQSRPAECTPFFGAPDDGTWALVAQIPVQLFSLYTTMLPIIRDKSLSVRPFWFVAGLSLSAVMTIVSPLVYGVSWRASTLLTYFASIFAMTCTTQLAGSILNGINSQELVQ